MSLHFESGEASRVDFRITPPGAGSSEEPGGSECGDTQFDARNCGSCGVVCPRNLSCVQGRCVRESAFRLTRFDMANCLVSPDHEQTSGDDRGGIALSRSHVFYTGDSAGISLDQATLQAVATTGQHDGLVSDLRDGTVYAFASVAGVERQGAYGSGPFVAGMLLVLDGTTAAPTGRQVRLSQPITLGNDAGIYAGFGRIIVHTGTGGVPGWFHIALPSGAVSNLGATPAAPNHQGCETWAHWGVAEFFEGTHHVLYVSSGYSGGVSGIRRYRIRDGQVTTVTAIPSIGDMCMFSFSPQRNRWVFHYESRPSFLTSSSYGEFVVSCPGAFSTAP